MTQFKTLSEVKQANKAIGNFWFTRGAMRFFNTKIESTLLKGRYFITSEQFDDNSPRLFSIRKANEDGSIDTVGDFQQYRTKHAAKEKVKQL